MLRNDNSRNSARSRRTKPETSPQRANNVPRETFGLTQDVFLLCYLQVDAVAHRCYSPSMARTKSKTKSGGRSVSRRQSGRKRLKDKGLGHSLLLESNDQATLQQLKAYEEGLKLFQQQKFARATEALERVTQGPNKELADRARVHLRICSQRLSRSSQPSLKSADDHYNQGIAMMNLGRWDDARVHLDRARKAAPKADHIVYAMAALDCLTGEAESSMTNLKIAIQLRPDNRYRARNDEDFAFLQEDPRFTELLYPERAGASG